VPLVRQVATGRVRLLGRVALLGALVLAVTVGASVTAAQAFVFRVSVGSPRGRAIPAGFIGLALEYRSIPAFTGPAPSSVNPVLIQLIRNLVPGGRPVLRIGGQSTDRTWWPVPGVRRPTGVTYDLTPRLTGAILALAQAANARLILSVGLEANRPRLAAIEAQQLLQRVDRRYVEALEVGNEPELYPVVPWYVVLNGHPAPWYSPLGTPIFSRPLDYDPSTFVGEFSRVLSVLPSVPVAGPDAGRLPWLRGFSALLSRRSPVRMVTWHGYGLNQCVTDPMSPDYPTVGNLLAPRASHVVVNGISPYVALAHRVGASFRVAEMNSVTCNGRVGVSDTFASALWAMDALFTAAGQGIDGVNIHTFQGGANGLFDFNRSHGSWQGTVHPLYYGVLAFAQAAPPGSRLLRVRAGDQTHARAWATIGGDRRIRVLLINDSLRNSALAVVRAPVAPGPASLERLRAPSAFATGGVTLGGRRFGAATATGLLAAPLPQSVAPSSGAYTVSLPAASAVLLTLPPS
jgi:hypothetical protein